MMDGTLLNAWSVSEARVEWRFLGHNATEVPQDMGPKTLLP